MIRTDVVDLTVIAAVAYRQKLNAGGSGIVILREDTAQPGIASISKTSGEPIPTVNTPAEMYPAEAFREAITLTAGLPYKKRGAVKLASAAKAATNVEEESAPEEVEVVVDSAEYQKIVDRYTDRSGKLSYALLNKDMIRFLHASSVSRRMIAEGAKAEEIRMYAAATKFRNVSGNRELTEAQVGKVIELLDEVSPRGVFKEFNDEIRRALKDAKK